MNLQDEAHRPSGHPSIRVGNIGVLLVNLGTPDGHDPGSVRRYLAEFLADRRVIELTPAIWWPILHGIILRTRPRRAAEAYRKVWRQESDESPLRYYTRRQAQLLAEALPTEDRLVVDWAMRYGSPSIHEVLGSLRERGCDRILIAPLYPQYSATTTATVNDKVFQVLQGLRWQPALRTLPPYYDRPAYIDAVAESLNAVIEGPDGAPEVILCSFHGLPQEYFDRGDPYYCHCMKTARLLRERLGLDEERLRVSFQSRFGPKAWLQPYTDETLRRLAERGVKDVLVTTPGFAADCLETLEEMGIQNRELFLTAGGERYRVAPCLNDSPAGIELLTSLVRTELAGWWPGPSNLPQA
jgi:ferrochelatase